MMGKVKGPKSNFDLMTIIYSEYIYTLRWKEIDKR